MGRCGKLLVLEKLDLGEIHLSASSKASFSRVFLQDVGGLGADLDDTYKEDINGFQSDHGNGSDEDLFEKSDDDF